MSRVPLGVLERYLDYRVDIYNDHAIPARSMKMHLDYGMDRRNDRRYFRAVPHLKLRHRRRRCDSPTALMHGMINRVERAGWYSWRSIGLLVHATGLQARYFDAGDLQAQELLPQSVGIGTEEGMGRLMFGAQVTVSRLHTSSIISASGMTPISSIQHVDHHPCPIVFE